jgi:hypothetical protein
MKSTMTTTTRRGALGAVLAAGAAAATALPASALGAALPAAAMATPATLAAIAPPKRPRRPKRRKSSPRSAAACLSSLTSFGKPALLSKKLRRGSTSPPRCRKSRGNAQTTKRGHCSARVQDRARYSLTSRPPTVGSERFVRLRRNAGLYLSARKQIHARDYLSGLRALPAEAHNGRARLRLGGCSHALSSR